jgi:hypothetical protein
VKELQVIESAAVGLEVASQVGHGYGVAFVKIEFGAERALTGAVVAGK